MPEWWMDFMVWLDTAYLPLWLVLGIFIAYFAWRFLRDMEIMRHDDPPPFD